jgi:hypothetical protein
MERAQTATLMRAHVPHNVRVARTCDGTLTYRVSRPASIHISLHATAERWLDIHATSAPAKKEQPSKTTPSRGAAEPPGSAEHEKHSDNDDDWQRHGKYPNQGRHAALLALVVEQVVAVGALSTAIASVASTAASVASIATVRSTEACLFAWARQA